jgi:hypothetical protein
MSTITINGNTYSGDNITISNGKVIINGKDVTPDGKEINISVQGNVNELKVDNCNKIFITGNVKNVSTKSADVDISGNVEGSIQTMSGDVDCGKISGSVSTMSGDIKTRK